MDELMWEITQTGILVSHWDERNSRNRHRSGQIGGPQCLTFGV